MEPLNDASGSSQDQATNNKRNRFAQLFVGSVTVALVLLIGTVLTYTARAKSVDSTDAPQLAVPAVHQHDNEFSRVAKAVEPAVVNINTESTVKNPHKHLHRMPPQPQNPDDEQEPEDNKRGLQDWFDHFFGQEPKAFPALPAAVT